MSWIDTLNSCKERREPCAMVVVVASKGSAPRDSGARMIVANGRLIGGTIGGGNLEKLAIEHATELLQLAQPVSESVDYPLSAAAGQCCGGSVTLFFETFPWRRRNLAVFGGGHVAQAVGGLAPWLSADVRLIDSRDEAELQPRPPIERPYEIDSVDAPEGEVAALSADTFCLIMTHDHALDLEIVAECLRRPEPLAYVGLIGSERKWQRFTKLLTARGFATEKIERIRCPIGLSKTSKEPGAIALSAAAEMVDVWNGLESHAPARAKS
ncbi:MAG: xanthine dehydrogenase accessory protein XdhC [Planctomycetota bacterium]